MLSYIEGGAQGEAPSSNRKGVRNPLSPKGSLVLVQLEKYEPCSHLDILMR